MKRKVTDIVCEIAGTGQIKFVLALVKQQQAFQLR